MAKKIKNSLNLESNQLAVVIDVTMLEDDENADFTIMPFEAENLDAPEHVKFFLRDLMRAMCACAVLPEGDLEALVQSYYANFIDFGDDDNIIPFPHTKH